MSWWTEPILNIYKLNAIANGYIFENAKAEKNIKC